MIELMPDADQESLVEWMRDFLTKELPRNSLLTSDVHDPSVAALMPRLGALGWFRLAAEGDGPNFVDEALLFRELGRHLVPGPLVWTAVAAELAARTGHQSLADSLAAGQSLAGVAEYVDDDRRLMVLSSAPAEHLLVVDPARGDLDLIRYSDVPDHELVASIDPFHEIAFVDASFEAPIATAGEHAAELLARCRLLIAAYLTGLAEGARDDSAAYASERVQFGKPIGAFQAVKHRCADNALRAEAAWASTVVAALRLGDTPVADAALDIAVAKVVAGDSAVRNGRDNIQNHGGMGYTFENLAHLYLKRAHVLVNVLGDTRSFTDLLLETTPSW